jgi:flagellar hook assembly protein FlgD
LPKASVGVEGFDQPLPQTFLLRQNYPNPFNPITTIEFSLGISADGGSKQRVNLDIYNILGRHVKSLVDGDMLPGNYQVQWDATNVSSQKVATGIYLYRLKVGSETKTKKMLFFCY